MADNTTLPGTGDVISTDDITDAGVANGAKVQRVKLGFGANNAYTDVESTTTNPLPVQVAAPTTGDTEISEDIGNTVGPAATGIKILVEDNAGAAQIPTLDASGNLEVADSAAAALLGTIDTNTGSIATDASTIAGAVAAGQMQVDIVADGAGLATQATLATIDTDTGNIATNTSTIAGAIAADGAADGTGILIQGDDGTNRKNINVDATTGDVQVDVTNSVTVTGPLTDTELRATAVPVSLASVPSHAVTNAGTFATQATLQAGTAAIGKLTANSGVDIGDVDVTSISAGTNLIGDVGLSGARTSGGTTPYYNSGTCTETQIVGTQAQIYWISALNTTATGVYLQLHNNTSTTVIPGTTPPTNEWYVPTAGDTNGAGFMLSIPNGIAYGNGITFFISTTKGGGTAATANSVLLNLGYAS